MLISCSSCNSKYLLNSADLKPRGRTVKCAKCGNSWFQTSIQYEEDEITYPSPSITKDKDEEITNSAPSTTKDINEKKKVISNLPSTYINEEKTSVVNSLILIIIIILIIYGFWFIKKNGIGIIPLLNFYFIEFFFNLNLIIKDIANIVKEILN